MGELRSTVVALAAAAAVMFGGTVDAAADGVPVGTATEAQSAEAQRLFMSGQGKSEAGDHAGALKDYQASFDVVASPNSLLLVQRELLALGRLADAYRAARATERLANEVAKTDAKYADTALSARNEAADLVPRIGFVKVDLAGKTGDVLVNGRAIPAAEVAERIAVDTGLVDVELRGAAGAEKKSATAIAGGEVTVSFVTVAPIEPPLADKGMSPFDMGTGQRITAGVLGGIGVVGMGLFAGFGAATLSIHSDLEEQCPGGHCPASLADKADDGRTFKTAANVSVAIGAVGLAACAALLIPTFLVSSDPAKTTAVVVGPGWFGVEGSFQ